MTTPGASPCGVAQGKVAAEYRFWPVVEGSGDAVG